MRRQVFVLFVLFVLVAVPAVLFAQASNVSGNGRIVVNNDYAVNNPFAGGYTGGSAGGGFSAGYFGQAEFFGSTSGNSYSTKDYAYSGGGTSTSSNVSAYGPGSRVSFSSEAHQNNWASVGSGDNYANGGNFTSGFYAVNFTSPWGVEGYGSTAASGNTSASTYEGMGYRGAGISTNGSSQGYSNLPADSSVSGFGGVNAFSGLNGGNQFATAGISGTAGYSGQFQGDFSLSGNTNVNVSGGTGITSAHAFIQGSVFTIPPPPPPPHP